MSTFVHYYWLYLALKKLVLDTQLASCNLFSVYSQTFVSTMFVFFGEIKRRRKLSNHVGKANKKCTVVLGGEKIQLFCCVNFVMEIVSRPSMLEGYHMCLCGIFFVSQSALMSLTIILIRDNESIAVPQK